MTDLKVIDFENAKVSSQKQELANLADFNISQSVPYVLGWQLAKRRSGTAKIKQMSEISGTTAKPHNQKGTGQARQGSKRSVQFRGGRTCFGPLPKDFGYTMPKKIVKKALIEAIKLKIKENQIILFDSLKGSIKTSVAAKSLLNNDIKSALVVFQKNDEDKDVKKDESINMLKIFGNIKNVKPIEYDFLNVYDLLKFDFLLLEKDLFKKIKEVIA